MELLPAYRCKYCQKKHDIHLFKCFWKAFTNIFISIEKQQESYVFSPTLACKYLKSFIDCNEFDWDWSPSCLANDR